ncbi:DUF397 domain-containing protein [Streptomyces sp. NPDC055099]
MSSTPDRAPLAWVKSSYSGNGGGNCLQWAKSHALTHGVVAVRDSKVPNGGTLLVSPASWGAFIGAVSADEAPAI